MQQENRNEIEDVVTPQEVKPEKWDFTQLLNRNIVELDVADSLRSLGRMRVTDWEFQTVIPAVKKTANLEVDVIDLLKRTANYKILDWDFSSAQCVQEAVKLALSSEVMDSSVSSLELEALTIRLKNFLQYTAVKLIDQPDQLQMRAEEIAPKVLRFTLVLVKRDVSTLVGREGSTASAIRSLMKAVAAPHGVHVLLDIHSLEQEHAMRVKDGVLN